MKRTLSLAQALIAFAYLLASANPVSAQCSNFNKQYPAGTQSLNCPASLTVLEACMYGGDYAVCSVVSGATYTWETCGDPSYDSQLTLWNTAHTTNYAYDDDGCSTQSRIQWTATFTGLVHVLLSEYNCQTNLSCMTLWWSCTAPPVPCTVSVPTGPTVSPASGGFKIPVTSNGVSSWTATESCAWLAISPTSGTGNDSVQVTYATNPNPALRTCDITFSCGTSNDVYTVTQYGNACTTCPDSDYAITPTTSWQTSTDNHGSTECVIYEITTIAGKDYTFKTGCGDGATADYDTELFLFDSLCNQIAADNDGCAQNRSVISYIATGSGPVYLKVAGHNNTGGNYTLAYKYDDNPSCSVYAPDNNTVGATADSTELVITSNGFSSWSISAPCTWATLSHTSGTGSDTVFINYQSNAAPALRTCVMNITCGGNNKIHRLRQLGTGPNLAATNTTINTSGNSISLSLETTNQGTDTAAASSVAYYSSFSPTIATTDYYLASDTVPALAPGESFTTNKSIDLDTVSGLPYGPLCVGYVVDYVNQVAESDEQDNAGLISGDCSVGLEEITPRQGISVYPNPNAGRFTIEYQNSNREILFLQVVNLTGKVVLNADLSMGLLRKEVDLSHCQKGIYAVVISGSTSSFAEKLIIR